MTDSSGTDIGILSENSYETVVRELYNSNLIKKKPLFKEFYKPCQ